MEENLTPQQNTELALLVQEASQARQRAAEKANEFVSHGRQKENVSDVEYRARLYRSMKKDQHIVKETKEERIAKSLANWRDKVGPTFAGATTEDPKILDRVSRLQSSRGKHKTSLVFQGDLGVGKAQPISEPVLTPEGFKPMGEIEKDDYVIGKDGKPTRVLEVHPQGERPVYKVSFNDGSFTFCDEEHLWTVITARDRKLGNMRTLTTRQLIDSGIKADTILQHRKYRIPMVSPVEFSKKEYIISPYIMGALLGDGFLGRQNISISSADQEILDHILEEAPEGVFLNQASSNKYDYSFAMVPKGGKPTGIPNIMMREIKRLGLYETRSHTKFIPKEYLLGSVEQRANLLRGIMDTDGETAKNVKLSWAGCATASKQLAEDIVSLVQSLGGIAKVKVRHNIKGGNHPSYRISVNTGSINPFFLPRKAEKIAPRTKYHPTRLIDSIEYSHDEKTQCISVEAKDNLYVTRDYIVTHNTWTSYAYINLAIASGAVTAGQIISDSETSVLGRISSGGFRKAEMIEELVNPRNKIYFIDDVGQGFFSTEQGRTEVWFELIDHIYTHQLTLLMTTNKQFTDRSLGAWMGMRAFDRLKTLIGPDGLVEPSKINRRGRVLEEKEELYKNDKSGS